MSIDVQRILESPVSRTGSQNAEIAYTILSGSYGSALEHSVFETLQGVESVSALKLLAEANNQGIPVFAIDTTNITTVLPQLTLDSAVINDIQNAVGAGQMVLVSRDNITISEWHGAGYIILNPQTGGAGYLISGGLAGGGRAYKAKSSKH